MAGASHCVAAGDAVSGLEGTIDQTHTQLAVDHHKGLGVKVGERLQGDR